MAKKPNLLIVGAGGHGRVVADTAEALGYGDISFFDQNWPEQERNLRWPIIGKEITQLANGRNVFVGVGANSARVKLIGDMKRMSARLPTLVHPTAYVSSHSVVGEGCYVGPQAVVNAGSALGFGVIINTGASVDHDCNLAFGVHVSPGARLAGGVTVGLESWVGIGACVREGIQIGERVMVGAGAVVVSHVDDNACVIGIPARQV